MTLNGRNVNRSAINGSGKRIPLLVDLDYLIKVLVRVRKITIRNRVAEIVVSTIRRVTIKFRDSLLRF